MLEHLGVRVLPFLLRLVELKQVEGCHLTTDQSTVLLYSKVCECAHNDKEEDIVQQIVKKIALLLPNPIEHIEMNLCEDSLVDNHCKTGKSLRV